MRYFYFNANESLLPFLEELNSKGNNDFVVLHEVNAPKYVMVTDDEAMIEFTQTLEGVEEIPSGVWPEVWQSTSKYIWTGNENLVSNINL